MGFYITTEGFDYPACGGFPAGSEVWTEAHLDCDSCDKPIVDKPAYFFPASDEEYYCLECICKILCSTKDKRGKPILRPSRRYDDCFVFKGRSYEELFELPDVLIKAGIIKKITIEDFMEEY